MSGLARRITTTTTTTSSAASSRIIGGDDGDDGVVMTERIGSDHEGGGGTMVFRGGGAAARMPIRSLRYESVGTADEGDTEDLMEPDMSDTSHMKFVDGRCSCCPYGYHVDLDFLQYLDSVNNGDDLNSLKKVHHNKAQLRKSMESYYLQQQEMARRGVLPGSHPHSGGLPPGAEHSREIFTSTMEKENRSATKVLDDIDRTIEGHLSTLDHSASIPSVKTRRVLTDGTNRTSDVQYDKTYTETIELRKLHHHHQQQQQPRNHEFDSGSSLSISSGPSSPTFPYPGLEPSAPCGVRTGPPETSTTSHQHSTTTVSFQPKQNRLLELEQQLLEIKPIPPTDQFQRTYINSAEFASNMAGLLPPDFEQDRATPTNERPNGAERPGQNGGTWPGRDGGTWPGKDGGTWPGKDGGTWPGKDGGTWPGKDGEEWTEQETSTEMTRISAATLQAIREQMAASLQRMHELEEQVKAIPVLQVRNSVLKEEKRMLELQMQSKADRMRSIGVGDYSVDESDFDERSELSYLRSLHSGTDEDRLRVMGLRREGEGTDEDGLYRSTTTVSIGYGVDGELIPVRVHEKELKTEENTEIREKETKTIFLGGGGDVLTTDLSGVERQQRVGRLSDKAVKRDVRSIGVGEGNVFDARGGGVEVHQKELRTVYIGDAGKDSKATRNVGILCKPAMRDVGMVHMTDSERPMQRTIAVGVGEIGVGEGGGGGGGGGIGYYVADDGVEGGSTQTMNTAMSQMTISAYQSRFGGLRNDQLRNMLDEMLKRSVCSVAIQCTFSTEDKGVDASRVGYDMVDVACSDDVIDVDVVPIRIMKSVAIDNRPSLFHRSCGTDYVYKIDMATNTQTQGIRAHRSTNTEPTVTFPAATNTDTPVRVSQAAETEKAIFYATEQLHNMGTNTNIQQFANVGFNTELIGDVMPLVIKPEQKDSSINTATSSVRVWDKMTNTTPSQRSEKAVNTSAVPQFDRGINTEKTKVSVASVNTERGMFVSRGVDCNIIQPEKQTSEGITSTSREIVRSTRLIEPEPVKPSGSGGFSEVYTTTTKRLGGSALTEERPRPEPSADDRSEFEEEVMTGSSGGRTTTTRVVKTVTRGGRSEVVGELPVAELGFRGTDVGLGGSGSQRTVTTTIGRPGFEEGFGTGGRSSTTRTVTMTSRGGRSDLTRDFPEKELGFQSLGNEQVAETEGSSSRRIITTRTERPEEAIGFGGTGGRSSTTRTVVVTGGGGRSELLGDFPAGELDFQSLGDEQVAETEGSSSRRIITTRTERPEDAIGFGGSGGRSSTTRTVTTVSRGGRSGLSEDFPSEVGGLETVSSRRAITSRYRRPELGDEISVGSSGGKTMTTRTVRTITQGGGGRVEVSEEFPSGEVGFHDDREHHLLGSDVEGGSSNLTTRTVRKTFHAGGAPQLEGFGDLDLASDAGSLRRTIISGDESQLLSKMGDEFSMGLQSGGQGGYSSSRTVIKRVSGDPDDPDAWHEETWVSGGSGDESTGQMTGFSSGQTEAVEFPEQRSSMSSETRTEHHVTTGQSSSSSFSSGATATSTEEPLKSIMKTSRSGDQPANAGRRGITFSETVDSKYEAGEELELACKLYGHWLQDSTHVSAQQLNSSLAAMQKEWFKVSSHKASSSAHVESYMKMVENVSWDLRRKIVNMEDANGNTALHYAVSNGNLDVVSLLLETGDCDTNHQNKTGCTAIMMAALTNVKTDQHQDVIRQLFQTGDVNIQAPSGENIELAGQTALMLAVSHGRLDMVKLLLDCGANVNLQDDDGSTALMVAAEHGHVDITRLLLSHADCDALIADKEGSTAMSIAKDEGRQSIVTLLNAHLNSKTRTQSSSSSQHKARKTVTRITLSSPTTEMS